MQRVPFEKKVELKIFLSLKFNIVNTLSVLKKLAQNVKNTERI